MVLISLCSVLGVVLFFIWDSGNKCDCTSKAPQGDKSAPNFESADSKSIANFLGYFKYMYLDGEKSKVMYLPVELKSISVIDEGPHNSTFIMSADCATVTIVLRSTATDWEIQRMVAVPKLSDTSSPFFKLCSIDYGENKVRYPLDSHYSCHVPIAYDCSENEPYARNKTFLYIEHLEFELHGEPDMISMGVYSTRGFGCQLDAEPANYTQPSVNNQTQISRTENEEPESGDSCQI